MTCILVMTSLSCASQSKSFLKGALPVKSSEAIIGRRSGWFKNVTANIENASRSCQLAEGNKGVKDSILHTSTSLGISHLSHKLRLVCKSSKK